MNFLQSTSNAISTSFGELFYSLVAFIPALVSAIIILIVGLLIAGALSKLVQRLVEMLKVDNLISKIDIIEKMNHAGGKVHLSVIIGWLVKWFLILATLIAVADILQLTAFNQFLNRIALYFPNVVIAVLILVAGLVFGNGVSNVIRTVIKSSNLKVGAIVATVAKWAIVIFAIMAALSQLEIATGLISTLFTGIVFMLALAGGLAFGLGGKDAASDLVQSLRDEMKH